MNLASQLTAAACRLLVLCLLIPATGCVFETTPPKTYWRTLNQQPPIIIAHRGDSGSYPEHTLIAYQSALLSKADFIEPDIVLTKDGVPICRHDLSLMRSTNVAPPGSRASPEQYNATGYTLDQVKRLQAIQPIESRPASSTRLSVPTLHEVIELIDRHLTLVDDEAYSKTDPGLYIEIKEPAKHRAAGLDPSKAVLELLDEFQKAGSKPRVILQCFDRAEAERLAAMTDYPVVWLSSKRVDLNNLPKGIAGLGLKKNLIDLVEDDEVVTGMRSQLVDAIHAKGLFVHAWTFRDDQLEGTGHDDAQEEIEAYLLAGVDGVFTDYPETGIDARDAVVDEWRGELLGQRVQKSQRTR